MTGNKFRARADECFREAHATADPERKLAQIGLAHRWLRLAAQIDEVTAETLGDARIVPLQALSPAKGRAKPISEPPLELSADSLTPLQIRRSISA
jgi:hypothetical protein